MISQKYLVAMIQSDTHKDPFITPQVLAIL